MKDKIKLILEDGNLGFYRFYKATMILLNISGTFYNYFTNIDFSEKYDCEQKLTFLTHAPIEITPKIKLMIGEEIRPVEEFIPFWENCIINNSFTNNGITVLLDSIFETPLKYVPSTDPTGGQFNLHIPIEKYLYGSNFQGNYYLLELFSAKNYFDNNLITKDFEKIQNEIKKCHLQFDLKNIADRVGNIVCKFNIEVISAKPLSLGYSRGISYEFSKDPRTPAEKTYSIEVIQEFDKMIYEYFSNPSYTFDKPIEIPPNQFLNKIIIIDNSTNLIVFHSLINYIISIDYTSLVLPSWWSVSSYSGERKLKIGHEILQIPFDTRQALGDIFTFIEPSKVHRARKQENAEFLKEQLHLISYNAGEHQDAISDIRKIMNNPSLLWDLEEILILDPYLDYNDIIATAFHCKKKGIRIRAVCNYGDIHNNRTTSQNSNALCYDDFKRTAVSKLNESLGEETDIIIEYRSVHDNHGQPFHDRYLILKYNINGYKVWSLGSSINSIGNRHSIIQIVATPTLIANIFEEIWANTDCENCLIFKNF